MPSDLESRHSILSSVPHNLSKIACIYVANTSSERGSLNVSIQSKSLFCLRNVLLKHFLENEFQPKANGKLKKLGEGKVHRKVMNSY